jgi:hypothetical protein
MGLDRTQMVIALRRARFAQNGRRARRDDHPCRRMSLQYIIVNWVVTEPTGSSI